MAHEQSLSPNEWEIVGQLSAQEANDGVYTPAPMHVFVAQAEDCSVLFALFAPIGQCG